MSNIQQENNEADKKSSQRRWMVDMSPLEAEISKAVGYAAANDGYIITSPAEYVRNEIIGPYLLFRNFQEANGKYAPMLGDLLIALQSDPDTLHKVVSIAQELNLPTIEESVKEMVHG